MSGGTTSVITSAAAAGVALTGAPTRLLVAAVLTVFIICGRDVIVAQIRRLQAREVAELQTQEPD